MAYRAHNNTSNMTPAQIWARLYEVVEEQKTEDGTND